MPYGNILHIPPTSYNYLAAKQEPYQKDYLVMKKITDFFFFNSGEMATRLKKDAESVIR